MKQLMLCLLFATTLGAQEETKTHKDARMAWWRDARFGMFIHWGTYSVPAGNYHGERVGGGEWIMNNSHIPIAEYEQFPKAFNPVKYDADAWVRIAKQAGMKYIIVTSKHHDGFAMFDSKVSSYDIVHASPYKKDAIKALAAAAQRRGIKFGVYYSIMDWHHPDAQGANEPNYNAGDFRNPNFDRYVDDYMKVQLKELLTQYPNIDVLWFDGEWIADWNNERGRDLEKYVRSLKPGILVNNRVGNGRNGMMGMTKPGGVGLGDFGTPEQQVPPEGLPGVDWETCMTLNENWGFQSFDDNWKSPKMLLRTLIDVAAKGGNLLLNVGPTALGEIPPQSVSRLGEMGDWLRVNGESIYGTTVSPYGQPEWGRYTAKRSIVYAHVFDAPKDNTIRLTGMTARPRAAYMLADHKPVTIEESGGDFIVTLPKRLPSSIASVVVLETSPTRNALMRAAVLVDVGRIEVLDVPRIAPAPHEVVVQVAAVGLCGTDLHIVAGHANYNRDEHGRERSLREHPQILGHEIAGVVVETGANVADVNVGDQVIVDQGRTCISELREPTCEYCVTGDSHQCEHYREHGITDLPGGLAEFITVPWLNTVRVETHIPPERAALSEPLGCIVHSTDLVQRARARYSIGGERSVRTILVFGGGPAGLLFTQYLRNVVGFDGQLLVSEPNARKRALAERFGAATIDPGNCNVIEAVADLSDGRKCELVIDASGSGAIFQSIPGVARKQATILLYGHGHAGVDMSALNAVQFLEPTLVAPAGASGAHAWGGRPATYVQALRLIEEGTIDVGALISHRYSSLAAVPSAFAGDHLLDDYVKGVVLL